MHEQPNTFFLQSVEHNFKKMSLVDLTYGAVAEKLRKHLIIVI